jgi:hypothetical protein
VLDLDHARGVVIPARAEELRPGSRLVEVTTDHRDDLDVGALGESSKVLSSPPFAGPYDRDAEAGRAKRDRFGRDGRRDRVRMLIAGS